MVRSPRSEKMGGLRRGKWTLEEDQKLISYIKRYGIWNWNEMPKPAGLLRSGKSCRLRWMNYLKPDIKLGNFSEEEEETILKLHDNMGNKWSAIAARLPGRTDNEIKNLWNTRLKKQLRGNPLLRAASKEVEFTSCDTYNKLGDSTPPSSTSTKESEQFSSFTEASAHKDSNHIPLPPYSFTAPHCSSSDADSATATDEQNQAGEVRSWMSQTFLELPSFWEQPFVLDDDELQETYVNSQYYMPPIPQVWYQEPVTPYGGYTTDLW